MRETGSTSYHPYPRKLECLTICRCLLCYFKTLSVGLVWNLNPEPLAPQLVLYIMSLPSVVKISFLELCNYWKKETASLIINFGHGRDNIFLAVSTLVQQKHLYVTENYIFVIIQYWNGEWNWQNLFHRA